jgi:hypothetical protein
MYGATSLAELDRAFAAPSERERLDFLDEFVVAVSSGWPQVMDLLESCALDREAREILRELQED